MGIIAKMLSPVSVEYLAGLNYKERTRLNRIPDVLTRMMAGGSSIRIRCSHCNLISFHAFMEESRIISEFRAIWCCSYCGYTMDEKERLKILNK